MNEPIVIRTITRLMLPFVVMFALYIQFHGEYSPGGGFQAGVILAAAFIAYALAYDLETLQRKIPFAVMRVLSAIGVLLYAAVGVVTMWRGGEFLNYSYLLQSDVDGQKWGIFIIELGVGLTVFAVMMLVFYSFAERLQGQEK